MAGIEIATGELIENRKIYILGELSTEAIYLIEGEEYLFKEQDNTFQSKQYPNKVIHIDNAR